MILVDTSVWVDHLRKANGGLVSLLADTQVACHPFVQGELACGNLKNRKLILSLLSDLPAAPLAEHQEVLELVETKRLSGMGIGWIDAHLLASALLGGCLLWTLDRRLRTAAAALGILF